MARAQTISVTDFYLDEKDLTASSRGTTVEDQNGKKCALIRVQTTEHGFLFDVGSLGVSKVEDQGHPGEIWVYVPSGVRHMSIRHNILGSLTNYDFPISIKSARVYVMKITSDKVFVNNYDDSHKQKLIIELPQAIDNGSQFSLNGMNIALSHGLQGASGSTELAFGTYTYKVNIPGYYPEEGQVVINDSLHAQTLRIDSLKPYTGKLSIHVNPVNTKVCIDGKIINDFSALTPLTLKVGKHSVQVSADKHRTETQTITIQKDQTTNLLFTLKQEAEFYFTSIPSQTKVSIKQSGINEITPFHRTLTNGSYDVYVTRRGYRDFHETMELNCAHTKVEFRLRKILNYKNEFYLGGSLRIGQYMGMGFSLGGYIHNVNIEGSYICVPEKSEDIYWCSESAAPVMSQYQAHAVGELKVGYAFNIGTHLRITPQLGLGVIKLSNTQDSEESAVYAGNSSACNLSVGTRISFALVNHLGISLTPQYAVSINQSDGYKALSSVSFKIKKWNEGFGLNMGIYTFF